MNALTVNPETGFLDAGSVNAFGSDRKKQFLEVCRGYHDQNRKWPDFGLVCKQLGISLTTFERHIKSDSEFSNQFRELRLGAKFQLESSLFDLGCKKGFEALIWLRKFFPEEYNPDHKVSIEHNVNVLGTLIQRAKDVSEVIDTQAL